MNILAMCLFIEHINHIRAYLENKEEYVKMRTKKNDPETIIALQAKEKTMLKSLAEKKKMIDKQIRETETRIKEYESALNQMRIIEADSIFKSKGISFDDVIAAVESGDLTSVTNKMQIAELINKVENKENITEFGAMINNGQK